MELYLGIASYIDFYNTERKHQGLEEQTPELVYQTMKKEQETITAFTT